MKRMLLGLFLALVSIGYADSTVEIKGALDVGNKYNFEGTSVSGKGGSGEIGAEYRYEVTPGLELGGGIAYQFHDELKDYYGALYNSIPIYGTVKYSFDTPNIKPYVKADLGYSINTDEAKDGLYYGVGGGVTFNDFNFEVMYKENKGKYSIFDEDFKADYRRVSLGVGYNIKLGY